MLNLPIALAIMFVLFTAASYCINQQNRRREANRIINRALRTPAVSKRAARVRDTQKN